MDDGNWHTPMYFTAPFDMWSVRNFFFVNALTIWSNNGLESFGGL